MGGQDSAPARFARLDRRRAFEAIVDQVRDAIFAGSYRVGDRLPAERELAEQFGVARHAVREAVRVLEHAGLVVVRRGAQGGIYVAAPRLEAQGQLMGAVASARGFSLEQLFRAKLLLEPPIAELVAADAADEDIAAIGGQLERERMSIAGPGEAYPDIAEFHFTVARALHNPLLEEMLRALESGARLVHAAGRPSPNVYRLAHREHGAVYAAIRRRRPRAARDAMAEHLKAMETRYLQALTYAGGAAAPRTARARGGTR